MIRLEGLAKVYSTGAGAVRALDSIDLAIDRGEFVALMGPSGSGKSTLMNLVGLLDQPSEGTYRFGDVEVGRLADDDRSRLRGRAFGFVFQAYNLLPRMSALEQVELPLVYQAVPRAERRRRAARALATVGLEDRAHFYPTELSGGQQQRVAIARALVVRPLLLLADEPTGALDTETSFEVMDLLSGLVESEGLTVLLVTHEEEIADFAARLIRMRDGHIVSDERSQDRRAHRPAVVPVAGGAE